MKKYLVEFIGTFFLTSAVLLSGSSAQLGIGCMFMAMIYWGTGFFPIGYFNPAVTMALTLKGQVKLAEFFWYILAQITGAFFVIFLAKGGFFLPRLSTSNLPTMSVNDVMFGGLFELLSAFVLCSVIITVITQKYKELGGIIIGFTLTALISTALLSIHTGIFNPAIAAGVLLFSLIKGSTDSLIAYTVYFFAPFIGGFFAYIMSNFLRNK